MKNIYNTFSTWLKHDQKHILYVILIAALVIRIGFVLALNPHKYYFSDTRHYDRAARSILDGNGFGEKYNRSPLYPVFMAGIYAVFGKSFVAMRLVESLVSVFICFLIYVIGRMIFSTTVGLIAAAVAAVYPHFILLAGILYSTNIFTLFLALSLFLLLKADREKSVFFSALSGLVSGLAALTIPSLFFILPFWILWLVFKPSQSWLLKLKIGFIYLFIFALTLVPWTLRNYKEYGRFTLVRPIPSTVLPNLKDLNAQKREIENGYQGTTEYLKLHPKGTKKDNVANMFLHYVKNPWGTVKYVVGEMGHFWALYPDRLNTPDPEYRKKIHKSDARMATGGARIWKIIKIGSIMVMAPVFALALLGLVVSGPFERNKLLLILTIFSIAFGYSMILAEVRYRIPVEPYILMFMAAGIAFIFKRSPNYK